jgi:hypothetical protein
MYCVCVCVSYRHPSKLVVMCLQAALCPYPTWMVIKHTQHMNTSYPGKISSNNVIHILYFNVCWKSHT